MSYGNYPDLSTVKRVLVVKLRHLGDVLLTTPVFSALKLAMPVSKIDAYIYEEAKPILEGHPALSCLIGYDRKVKKFSLWKRIFYEISLLRRLRREKYDLVINLTEGDRGVLVALLSGAKIKVGFDPKGFWQKKVFTHLVKHCPGLRHTVERNLDAIRRIGIFPSIEDRELFFHIDEKIKEKMQSSYQGPFILIHPTSRWKFKCLPIAKMRQLVASLIQDGKKVVLVSGPGSDEKEMVMKIAEGFDAATILGEISLKELGALIAISEMLICVDSMAFHVANALKKPVVAFFGPTSEVTWGAWRNPYARVMTKQMSCRPCYQDGCGGSKYSDCLATLDISSVVPTAINNSYLYRR